MPRPDSFTSRVSATLEKYQMLSPGERVLVASSGGPDSVALFHALREFVPDWNLRLHLIHFDHGLRPGSQKDFEFVRGLAQAFGIPFHGKKRGRRRISEKGLSPEEQAREMRYAFFREIARKTRIRKMALGHHRDDQAETVLMRLLQGTGLRGLQGIRPVMRKEKVTLIRPLFEVSRAEILEFLKSRKFPYREDRTNRSRKFLRNRIRHELLPLLERRFNPKVKDLLLRLAETAAHETSGLDEWIRACGRSYLRSRRNGRITLDRERFLALPDPLQFRLLDQTLRLLEGRSGLDFESWERIRKGLERGRYRTSLPRNLDLTLTPQGLLVRKV